MILDDFLERVNASVDWREATHDATKTEMSSLAFEGEDDIMMTIGGGAAWSTCLHTYCSREQGVRCGSDSSSSSSSPVIRHSSSLLFCLNKGLK